MRKQFIIFSGLVFLVFLSLIFYSQHSANADINTGLVGYWNFDATSGTTALDSSGSNNTGTLINGPTWTTGKIDNALSFDGVDDYVSISGNSDLVSNQGTIGFWYKPSSLAQS